jgi:hypothetical protein
MEIIEQLKDNRRLMYLAGNLTIVSNIVAIPIGLFMVFNFAFAPWSFNPVEDLLYVRSDGFILPANHISSALAVAGTAAVFMVKDLNNAGKLMFVIFSTASIHEYILDALNVPAMLAAHSLGYTITFRWFFWLAFFLIPGVLLATRKQRITMVKIALFCFVYIGGWIVLASVFNIDTYTILAYAPGPAFHDFIPNFFEVTSWVIPAVIWWLP